MSVNEGSPLIVSIGICAYNEERNIGRLLETVQSHQSERVTIKEIFVVSSGSTDNTEAIVSSYAQKDNRIKLILQPTRQGKVSAVNKFLERASGELCILVSADVLPEKDALEQMCLPLQDKKVGMAGGQIIPVNSRDSLMGFVGYMLWSMHHQIALRQPKLGEMVVFQNVVKAIPEDIAMDEAYIEAVMIQKGLTLKYVPQAVVHNKAAETVADFLRVRRRNYAGHLYLRKRLHYQTSTMPIRVLLPIALPYFGWSPRRNLWALVTILLEAYARFLGWYDFRIKKRTHTIWEVAASTKTVGSQPLHRPSNE